MQVNRCNIHIICSILFLVFIHLNVEYFLQGPINLSDTQQDQRIEHCRQTRGHGFKHIVKVNETEFYFNFQCKSVGWIGFNANDISYDILPELSATLYLHWLPPSPLVVATAALKAWVTSLKTRSVGSFFMAAFQSSTILSVTLMASAPFLDFFEVGWSSASSSSSSLAS